MYRVIATIAISGALAAAAMGCFTKKKSANGTGLKAIFFDKTQPLKTLIYALTGLSIFGLALTGFWAAIIKAAPLSGLLLMLHCTLAPVLCLSLTAAMIISAQRHCFDKSDWPLRQNVSWRKICFWVLMAAAVPVILSMVLSMLPLFGTVGQEFLYNTHRAAALFLTVSAFGYIGLLK
ncbi:hypothetical protein ACFL02_02240 [Planctomycetota bacterium]